MLIRLAGKYKMLTNYETYYFIKQRNWSSTEDIADVQDAKKLQKKLLCRSKVLLYYKS
jgi:hypothetical protein